MSAAPRRSGPGPALLGILGVAVVAGLMLTVGVVPAVALTNLGAKSGMGLFAAIPDDLKIATLQQKTEIYAKNGEKDVLLASFFNQDREVVTWDDVPDTVKNATLAAEDVRYYEHGGVDPMGIMSALVSNVMNRGSRGASTIAQQYVKNVCIQEAELLPTEEQVEAAYAECTGGIKRKLREARLAIGLEKVYDKDTILLGYLNIAGFGGRIYGIESAANYYYDKKAKDLSIAEAASLMAIVNNPAYLRLDDEDNLEGNKARRDYILDTELKNGMITKAEHAEAVATKIEPTITPTNTGCAQAKSAAYFCDYVTKVIQNDRIFGETKEERHANLQSSGWKIYTTLDMKLQKAAKEAMTASVPAQSPAGTDIGGAAVSVEVGTGRIISMVQSKRFDDTGGKGTGGKNYTATAVNWNTDKAYGGSGGFQPGSTYKAFTLIDWLEQGHGLYETVDGDARVLPDGALKACGQPAGRFDVGNDTSGEGGYQTVASATARSVNGAFASMAEKLDLCDIKEKATQLLVHRADGADLMTNSSSILGTNEVAPLSMATAYAGIANQGTVCASVAIDRIVDTAGQEVEVPKADCHQAIPKAVAVAAGFALHGVLAGGTASADAGAVGSAWGFAKTGTTDEAIDTWVVGGTTKTVTATWVGNVGQTADKTSLRQVYGYSPCGAASNARHCVWSGIQRANQAAYPGATSWPEPDQQYLYGQQIPIPDVAGKTVEEAKLALQQAGFRVKKGDETPSDTVPAGSVVSTDPTGQASAGTMIRLAISSGPEVVVPPAPTPGTVPGVVGMLLPDARNALAAAGFTQLTPGGVVTGGPACIVVAQTPEGGVPADPAMTNVGLAVEGDPAVCG